MDRLHDLISSKLGDDPALARAIGEAEQGGEELSERTRRRLTDSVEDAAERDPGFAGALEKLVEELQAASAAGGVSASGDGQAVGGNVNIRAEGGAAAAQRMGNVWIGATGNPPMPGPEQG